MEDNRTAQAMSWGLGIVGFVGFSVLAYVMAGGGRYSNGYFAYGLGGLMVLSAVTAVIMIVTKNWGALAGGCFVLATLVITLIHYLMLGVSAPTV